MASQPSNTFRHDGHAYTVTMIEPRLNANGQPSADAVRTAIVELPKVTNANRGKVVTVTGYFTPAKFTVTGFRHPIEFETNQTPVLGAPITIHWIAIGTRGGVELVSDWNTQGQISLDNLPLGKILAAAVKACAFTATTIAADEITESIELKTNGVRPATTAQQMISLARKAGHLEKPKPKKTKPKQRGKK